jgi:hypothetical protein
MHVGGNLLTRSLAFEESTFTVGGNLTTFYPIVFMLPTIAMRSLNDGTGYVPGPFNLTVFRGVHMDANSRGGMMINIEGHPNYWGYNYPYLSWKFENVIYSGYAYTYFVGNVDLAQQNPAVILYLRGGGTSYKYYGTGIRAVLNATEAKTSIVLPEYSETFTSKLESDISQVTSPYNDFTRASGWYDSRCAMRSISYEGSGSTADKISAVGTYIGGTSAARADDISSVLRFVTLKDDSNFIQSGKDTSSGSSLPIKITTMNASKTAVLVDPSAGYTYVSDRMKIGSTVNAPTQALDVAGGAVISGPVVLTSGGGYDTPTLKFLTATDTYSGLYPISGYGGIGIRSAEGKTISVQNSGFIVECDTSISGSLTVNGGKITHNKFTKTSASNGYVYFYNVDLPIAPADGIYYDVRWYSNSPKHAGISSFVVYSDGTWGTVQITPSSPGVVVLGDITTSGFMLGGVNAAVPVYFSITAYSIK